MLNYVWLGLLVLGIGIALVTDIYEKNENVYRNGDSLAVTINFEEEYDPTVSRSYQASISIPAETYNKFYNTNVKSDIQQDVKISVNPQKQINSLYFEVDDDSPEFWKEMAKVTGEEKDLTGKVKISQMLTDKKAEGVIVLEEISFAQMKKVTNSALDTAGTAVDIAIGLIGIMALWLGIMKIAEEAGLIDVIAKVVRPITSFLFPKVPSNHPAIGSIIMNISANMLGLGNAATPFGLKAMEELDKLNPNKGTATNAMVTFLAINTAGLVLIPATAIAVRAAAGSSEPAFIIGTSLFGAACATVVGITGAKIFEKFPIKKGEFGDWVQSNSRGLMIFIGLIVLAIIFAATGFFSVIGSIFSFVNPELFKNIIGIIAKLAIPVIIGAFVLFGIFKKVKIYEQFVEGAKEGFNVAVKIIPYLVAMLVAIGIFRAGGAMELLVILLKPATNLIGMPAECLPMAVMRPLSGSGSLGIMAELMSVHGPDSKIGILASTYFGSTETTFYVLAVYFGSVNIDKTRHALPVGLMADVAGILGATFIVNMIF
jgi:spore maturation protein SpmA